MDIGVGHVLVDHDVADVVQVDAPEVLAEEGVLDLALGVLVQVHALGIEELDLDDAVVEWRDADVDAPAASNGAST